MKKYLLMSALVICANSVLADDVKLTFQEDQEYELKDHMSIYDPLENVNRKIYSFNKIVDGAVIKPVAEGYKENVPNIIQSGVTNLINYIKGPFNVINYALQGNGQKAGDAMGRLIVNTFGFGVLDIASEAQIPLESTNFGETLGVWGVGEGPYVVLPILGGGTLRDRSAQLAVDIPISIEANLPIAERNTIVTVEAVDARKAMLLMDKTIEEAALDEYTFVKSAIVSNKRASIKELKRE